jgi:hypothetical protein
LLVVVAEPQVLLEQIKALAVAVAVYLRDLLE